MSAYGQQADSRTERLRHRAQAQQEKEAVTRLAMQRAADEYAKEAAKLAEEAHRAEERSAAKAAAEERSAARAATKKSSAKARAARRAEAAQARPALLQTMNPILLLHAARRYTSWLIARHCTLASPAPVGITVTSYPRLCKVAASLSCHCAGEQRTRAARAACACQHTRGHLWQRQQNRRRRQWRRRRRWRRRWRQGAIRGRQIRADAAK